MWSVSEGKSGPGYRVVSFYGLGKFHMLMSGRNILAVPGERVGISRSWATAHFLAFYGQPWNCHGARGSDFF